MKHTNLCKKLVLVALGVLLIATMTIAASADDEIVTVSGSSRDNQWANGYSWNWADLVDSYLYENSDGTLTKIDNFGDYVQIQVLTTAGAVKSTKKINKSLEYFMGAYCGSNYNFLVYGKVNSAESNSTEIMRVVKYDKSWNQQGTKSFYGENTYEPGDAGSCRMVEADGILYIYTCHTMYKSSDGYHHQANMTFAINEKTLNTVSSYSGVMNFSWGYVSHSFNQYILTDGSYIYRFDHGDAYPRALTMTKTAVGDDVTDPILCVKAYTFPGAIGNNYTGAELGGAALLSNSQHMLAKTTRTDSSGNYLDIEDITLISINSSGNSSSTTLASYDTSKSQYASAPQIVAVDDSHLLCMWGEQTASKTTLRVMLVDATGNIVSKATKEMALSDCQPILRSDGMVSWYASNGTTTELYTLDPFHLIKIGTPTITGANANGGYKLSWSKCNNADKYSIYRKTDGGSYTKIAVTTSTSYLDTTAVQGTNYTYRVRPYNTGAGAYGTYSNTVTGTYLAYMTPKSVYNIVAGTKITWTSQQGVGGYTVYRKEAGGSWKKLASVSASTTSYTDKTAVSGTTYSYAVRSYSGSYYSAYGSTSIVRLAAPTETVRTIYSGVKIEWTKISGASGYYIYRRTESGSFEQIGTAKSTATSYTDTKAVSGQTYIYCVKAYQGTSLSSYNSSTAIKFLGSVKPTVTATTGKTIITWSKIGGASGYYVYRKTASGSWTKIGKTTGTSYTDTTGAKGTTYYYCVKAYSGSVTGSYQTSNAIVAK